MCLLSYFYKTVVRAINREKKSILHDLIPTLSDRERKWLYTKKITGFSTWFKYKSIYHPNVALKKLKEDCCDTCMKYELALKDSSISESDKKLIRSALSVILNNIMLD